MPTTQEHTTNAAAETGAARPPDTLILVFNGDSGLWATLLDVAKKAVGRGDCALCDITYSPVGKRAAWSRCAARLGIAVRELHRDEIPDAWGIARGELPCVLARAREERPFILVTRDEIVSCRGDVEALERTLRSALAARGAGLDIGAEGNQR
jgi:hypothetical protein